MTILEENNHVMSFYGDSAKFIGHNTGLALSAGAISLNFTTENAIQEQGIFSKDSNGYDNGGHLTLTIENGELVLRAQTDTESIYIQGGSIIAGHEHSVNVVWDDAGTISLYLDNQLIGSQSGWSGLEFNEEPIVIGATQANSADLEADKISDHFTGEISDFNITNGDGEPVDFQIGAGSPDGTMVFTGQFAEILRHEADYETNNGSISFEFNADVVSDRQGLFSKDSSGYDNGGHLTLKIVHGKLQLRAQTATEELYIQGGSIEAGIDYSVEVSWNDNETVTLLLDGNEIGSADGWVGLASNEEPLIIGASQHNSGDQIADRFQEFYTGEISNFKLSNFDAPVLVDDYVDTEEDNIIMISLLSNDSDANDDNLIITHIGAAANGTVFDNNDGTVTYTPDADFSGTDTFTYTVTDGQFSRTASAFVEVIAVNDAPEALDDTLVIDEGASITFDVLSNDGDIEGDDLFVNYIGSPRNGTLSENENGTVTYTPHEGFSGTDSFVYTINDGQHTDTANVVINVNGIDDSVVYNTDFDSLPSSEWLVSTWDNAGNNWNKTAWSADNITIDNGIVALRLGEEDDRGKEYSGAEFQSREFYGYGAYEVTMKVSAENGVNSTFFTYTGSVHGNDKNEIDFEFLGKDPTRVWLAYHSNDEDNFQGQGGEWVHLGFDASQDFHTYRFEWKENSIEWFADGRLLKTVMGDNLGVPDTAGKMYMSLWAGAEGWMGATDETFTETFAYYDNLNYTSWDSADAVSLTEDFDISTEDIAFVIRQVNNNFLPDNSLINLSSFTKKTQIITFETGDDISGVQVIYEQGGGTAGLNFFLEHNMLHVSVYDRNSGSWGYKQVDASIEANTRYSATMVMDSDSGTLKLYMNGTLAAEVNGVGELPVHGGDIGIGQVNSNTFIRQWQFFGNEGNDYWGFKGTIDKLVQYNTVLNEEEFSQLHETVMKGYIDVNITPDAVDDAFNVNENEAATLSLLNNDTDDNSDVLSILNITSAIHGTVVDNGDGTVLYEADPGYYGEDNFTYTVTDGEKIDTATVHVNVEVVEGGTELTNGDDVAYFYSESSHFIDGLDGHDTIVGGDYNDVLMGGNGNDILSGKGGEDILVGGEGNDTFLFDTISALDTVKDFQLGEDILDISAILEGGDNVESMIADFISIATNENTGKTYLMADQDGSGDQAAMEIVAQVDGLSGIDISDLVSNNSLLL